MADVVERIADAVRSYFINCYAVGSNPSDVDPENVKTIVCEELEKDKPKCSECGASLVCEHCDIRYNYL